MTHRRHAGEHGRALYFVIALCVFTQSNRVQAQCIIEGTLSCNVYNTCFDIYCPCTSGDNYFISYGRKYCDRFLNETAWSAAGKQWRDKTLLCLQKSIAAKLSLQSPRTCNCREMKEFAFQTHINCYTQNAASICKLPVTDWTKILSSTFTVLGRSWRRSKFAYRITAVKSPQILRPNGISPKPNC
jgi:hypothetical protein